MTWTQGRRLAEIKDGDTTVASYTYNAWGEVTASGGDMADINPIRYRGYYYDTETGFYYLQSRYYDPAICRFINADAVELAEISSANNLFIYCSNNPVLLKDITGELGIVATSLICGVVNGIISLALTASTGGDINALTASFFGGFMVGAAAPLGIVAFASAAIANGVLTMAADVDSQKAAYGADNVNYGASAVKGGISFSTSLIPTPAGEGVEAAVNIGATAVCGVITGGVGTGAGIYVDATSTHRPNTVTQSRRNPRVNTLNARAGYSRRLYIEKRSAFWQAKLNRV